jgi:hypothetical protein
MESGSSAACYCVRDVTRNDLNKGLAMQLARRETAQVMSEENVELVRQALNAWIEVDEGLAHTGRLYEFFAPDADS